MCSMRTVRETRTERGASRGRGVPDMVSLGGSAVNGPRGHVLGYTAETPRRRVLKGIRLSVLGMLCARTGEEGKRNVFDADCSGNSDGARSKPRTLRRIPFKTLRL